MAIGGSNQDFERQKFVESPTRPGNAVPEVSSPAIESSFNQALSGIRVLTDSEILKTIQDRASGSVTYIGESKDANALSSEAKWRISRILINGNITTTQYANGGSFDQIFDNRTTLFAGGGYGNIYSLNFDGINDSLNGGNIHNFDIATAFSFSLWIKPQNLAASRIIFAKAGAAPGVVGYMVQHNVTTGKIQVQMRTGATNTLHEFDVAVTAGVWNHVVFTYAGGSNLSGASAYVNAVKNTTSPSGALTGSMQIGQDFTIGERTSGFYFSGNMDEILVFNKALSQSEVAEIYNSGAPFDPTTLTTSINILSFYPFDGDIYPTVSDNVGSNDLTMINMTSDDFEMDVP